MRLLASSIALLSLLFVQNGGLTPTTGPQAAKEFKLPQKLSLPPPIPTRIKTLHVESEHSLGVPQFGYFGQAQVDSSGDLFFAVGAGADLRRAVVMEIREGNQEPILYRPKDASGDFVQFAVSPSGSVHILSVTPKETYAITSFDSEGEPTGITSIQISGRIQPTDLLAFDDDNFVLGGFFREAADQKDAGTNYLALLDPNGKVVKTFGGDSPKINTASLRTHLFDGASCIGSDGNIYIVRGERISIADRTGSVIGSFSYPKPAPDFVARRIARTGRFIVLWLRDTQPQGADQVRFLLIDASSHETYALYAPDEAVGANAMYYKDGEGFTFLGVKDSRVTLVKTREE